MLTDWYVWVGGLAATLAVLEAARRLLVGVWRFVRAVVRIADAMPRLLEMPEALRSHTEDDASFQEWIIGKLERVFPTDEEGSS